MLNTGIWTTDRNHPEKLTRERPYAPIPTVEDFTKAAETVGMELQFQDFDELARYALDGIKAQHFVIMIRVEEAVATLQERARRYALAELPIDLASIPQL